MNKNNTIEDWAIAPEGADGVTLDSVAECWSVSAETYTELWSHVVDDPRPREHYGSAYEYDSSGPNTVKLHWKNLSDRARREIVELIDSE